MMRGNTRQLKHLINTTNRYHHSLPYQVIKFLSNSSVPISPTRITDKARPFSTCNLNDGHENHEDSLLLLSSSLSATTKRKKSTIPQPLSPFTEQSIELVKDIADEIRCNVRSYTSKHKLNLLGISTSRSLRQSYQDDEINIAINEGIESYSESVAKSCAEDGIHYELWRLAGGYNICQQLNNMVHRANSLPNIHGILMYYPLISNRPQVLGWSQDRDSIDDHGNRRWSLEDEQMNIGKGYGRILERNRERLPGLSYKTRDDFYRSLISHKRDVEGLCPQYHSRAIFRNPQLYVERLKNDDLHGLKNEFEMIFPCTALAVVKIMQKIVESYHQKKDHGRGFEGVVVTIINRSEILGRPLASMLANDGAAVYSIDKDSILLYSYRKMRRIHSHLTESGTLDVESCVRKSNVIVTAVPSSTFKVPTSWIQPGSQVINVASEPNIDEKELGQVQDVTYIPQIGKVTIAILESNLMKLHQRFHQTGSEM